MDSKMQQLVEEAIDKGLTYQSWILILALVIIAGLSAFINSYLKKKGEQKAHEEIQDQLNDHQFKLISATETLKGDITNQITRSTEYLKLDLAKDLATFESDLAEKIQVKIEILLPRIESYKSLWALTYTVRPTRTEPITDSEKSQLEKDMTNWYYNLGNGLFLSTEAGKLWRQARRSLTTESDDLIKAKFSSLRTQLKLDTSVYGKEDADIQLGK